VIAVSLELPVTLRGVEESFVRQQSHARGSAFRRRVTGRLSFPSRQACFAALLSALLLVASFPDFNFSWLAWGALVPVLVVVGRRPRAAHGFLLGWLTGTTYFYLSCYWVTYPMINYAGIPWWLAYTLLLPAALILGLFPALACGVLARACVRWDARAILFAPVLWTAWEWLRFELTGQLWNALGYTQAFRPALIQAATWGGVYAVSFMLVAVSAAIAYLIVGKDKHRVVVALLALGVVSTLLWVSVSEEMFNEQVRQAGTDVVIVAVQPNVIPDFDRPAAELRALRDRHFSLAAEAFATVETDANLRDLPRVVVFPESPMNFQYERDGEFRRALSDFATRFNTGVLFNSLEPAPGQGGFNSAVLVDARGRLVEQYDKIQLVVFGEYIPLPRWVPGREFVRAIVGEFTPGERYTLMRLGNVPSGTFICFETAFPTVARRFTERRRRLTHQHIQRRLSRAHRDLTPASRELCFPRR
jgi:apolipoprotein N-acyltransferase